jgi:hypothetical protein
MEGKAMFRTGSVMISLVLSGNATGAYGSLHLPALHMAPALAEADFETPRFVLVPVLDACSPAHRFCGIGPSDRIRWRFCPDSQISDGTPAANSFKQLSRGRALRHESISWILDTVRGQKDTLGRADIPRSAVAYRKRGWRWIG